MSKYKMKSASYCATNMRPSKDTSLVQYPFEINNEIDGNEDAFSTIFKMYCIECKSHLQPNVKVVSQRELLQTFSIVS